MKQGWRFRSAGVIAIAAVVVAASMLLAPAVALNLARVSLVQYRSGLRPVASSLVSIAELSVSRSLRWRRQIADSFARAGDCQAAIRVYADLAQTALLSREDARVLAMCQAYVADFRGALDTLRAFAVADQLAPDAAARILVYMTDQKPNSNADEMMVRELFAVAFGVDGSNVAQDTIQGQFAAQITASTNSVEMLQRAFLLARDASKMSLAELSPAPAGLQTQQSQIAGLLALPPDTITLQRELIANGELDHVDQLTQLPMDWTPVYMSTGMPWNLGYFGLVSGADAAGNRSVKISCEYLETQSGRELARAGMGAVPVTLTAGHYYVISVDYRTRGVASDAARIFLSLDPTAFPPIEHVLKPADRWTRATIVFRNKGSRDVVVYPTLRLFSTGDFWFDNVSIRELVSTQSIELPTEGFAASETEISP